MLTSSGQAASFFRTKHMLSFDTPVLPLKHLYPDLIRQRSPSPHKLRFHLLGPHHRFMDLVAIQQLFRFVTEIYQTSRYVGGHRKLAQ